MQAERCFAGQRVHPPAQSHGVLEAMLDAKHPVVLQIFAHAGEIVANLNAQPTQEFGRTDAGHLQDRRRAEGAGCEYDFASRLAAAQFAANAIAYAGNATAGHVEAFNERLCDDGEIGPRLDRLEERL